MASNNPIDAVITWVDSNDENHRKKLNKYINLYFGTNIPTDDIAGETRYNSIGEIKYCVASILRFAPFIRKIFIVTDNQDPQIESYINQYFPDRTTQIEIVDHKIIFKGYEEYLPVFNSLSIETMLWRIPDLSNNFVYFNDDVFLMAPVKISDWFVDDKVVAYGYWHYYFTAWLLDKYKILTQKGKKMFSYKDSMRNAAVLLNAKYKFWRIVHVPFALKKDAMETYFNEHQDQLLRNISSRFRSHNQFNPQSLFYTLQSKNGKCVHCFNKNKYFYIKPSERNYQYMEREIKKYEKNGELIFSCMNSLDQAESLAQEYLLNWLKRTIKVN
ncbi:MAG: Stealth CR1 domain-containing protein [Bacteroidales bacterium]|nr:Stealth CR1 domain-containing protein [Bacteroidales bacterium]